MSPKALAKKIFERHPDLKELSPKQLKVVERVIQDAIHLSVREGAIREFEDSNEVESWLRKKISDSGSTASALRGYRKRANLTQRALAEKSAVPQPHIAAMESGKRSIGLISAKKLALALGISYRKLV